MGLSRAKLVWPNILKFLQQTYEAIDKKSNPEIVAVYTEFAKTFDKVPHFELTTNVAHIGIGDCLLETLFDCPKARKQFLRLDHLCSEVIEVTKGVP